MHGDWKREDRKAVYLDDKFQGKFSSCFFQPMLKFLYRFLDIWDFYLFYLKKIISTWIIAVAFVGNTWIAEFSLP